MILGVDIGGANTKAASSDGRFAEIRYLPLWKRSPLGDHLAGLSSRLRPDAVGVVMTGELADCFESRREGVMFIASEVKRAFDCTVHFWGLGGFHESISGDNALDLAAANWSASIALLLRDIGECIFVDMGSTTTDIIPVIDRPLSGCTDLKRLMRGELIYTGVLRTNLAALLPCVYLSCGSAPLSSELFSITADAYLALGDIKPDAYSCETPDSGPKSREGALRRLARTVCSDLDELGEDGALSIAAQAKSRQISIISSGISRIAERHNIRRIVAAGVGEFIVEAACERAGLECIRLSEIYTERLSDVFPAFAVARLLSERYPVSQIRAENCEDQRGYHEP
ncbi:MAG TPA: hydantoinase/oxoprolinase family protein [Methanothrix sp.]|nr:hydantoinase/oxoprolinase family protein [Methanothrix sp.]HOK58046.1 hydantoinase/oxoprolinase family protein [Methanothrix sp.]HOL43449.1 hydantoinase/oxoprolinase family protein [Methanothrix sp.]HPO88533.1 hydantoinase/oxoprolinase family protein [Methanothrix sp.]